MEPIIRVEHLTHTYSAGTPFQRSAVEDVSIDVMPGEFLGIIGHTGSGKSTLIQHLNGLLRPTQGRVLLVQAAAVNAAINAFNKELLASHIRTCVAQDIRDGKDQVIDELVATLQKLMK